MVTKLFKDKYGHRNFRDFFGKEVDSVLELELVDEASKRNGIGN